MRKRGHLGESKGQAVAIPSRSGEMDTTLRFHKSCKKYDGKAKEEQKREFSKIEEPLLLNVAKEMIKRSAGKLEFLAKHLNDSIRTARTVTSLWDICRFEVAIHGSHTDGLCNYFNETEYRIFDYIEDAAVYWMKSYGLDLNHQMSCNLVKEILMLIQQESINDMKVAVRFAHAETLIPLVTRMGLFHQEDISDIYDGSVGVHSSTVRQRKWRSGQIAPFGGNLLFEVHSCKANEKFETFVKVVLNEVPVRVCSESIMCSFEELSLLLDPNDCNFSAICD